jgi:ubiquitin carboxyl-terminal hydrolase 7
MMSGRVANADYVQEIKAGMIEGMKIKQTFMQNEIQDGDIIAYQVEMTEKEWVSW